MDLWSSLSINQPLLLSTDKDSLLQWESNRRQVKLSLVSSNLEDMIVAQQEESIPEHVHQQPIMKLSHHSKYHNYNEIVSFYEDLAQEYPGFVHAFVLGKTYEGREIKGFRITSPNSTLSREKPEFLYHGAIHAREWIGPATLQFISQALLEGYGSGDSTFQNLLNTFTYTFIPVLNVDGFTFTHEENRMWRKNREPTNFFCIGTDMNRNFDAGWYL